MPEMAVSGAGPFRKRPDYGLDAKSENASENRRRVEQLVLASRAANLESECESIQTEKVKKCTVSVSNQEKCAVGVHLLCSDTYQAPQGTSL